MAEEATEERLAQVPVLRHLVDALLDLVCLGLRQLAGLLCLVDLGLGRVDDGLLESIDLVVRVLVA